MRRATTFVTGVLLALVPATAAVAHVGTGGAEVRANATTVVELTVPHGCGGEPTTGLEVRLPEGFTATAEDAHGFTASVDGDLVTWSGGSLTDGVDGAFPLHLTAPDVAGRAYLRTLQHCGDDELTWIDIGGDGIAEGQPAPSVVVVGGATALDDPARAMTHERASSDAGGWLVPLLVGGGAAAATGTVRLRRTSSAERERTAA